MPEIIKLSDSLSIALDLSEKTLNQGGLIVFPTDTVYGLAAKFDLLEAIQRIYQVKGRDQTKALPVLLGNVEQIKLVAAEFPGFASSLAENFWPGALTIVLQKKSDLISPLSMDNTIGIRIPNDNFVRELAGRVGPLATTSANRSGFPSAINIDEVLSQIGDFVDVIVDGGQSEGGVPSTVVDCREKPFRILREGAISREEIFKVLNK